MGLIVTSTPRVSPRELAFAPQFANKNNIALLPGRARLSSASGPSVLGLTKTERVGTVDLLPTPGGMGFRTSGGSGHINVGKVPKIVSGSFTLVFQVFGGSHSSELGYVYGVIDESTSYIEYIAINRDFGGGSTYSGRIYIVQRSSAGNTYYVQTGDGVVEQGKLHTFALKVYADYTKRLWRDGVEVPLSLYVGSAATYVDSGLTEFDMHVLGLNFRGSAYESETTFVVTLWARLFDTYVDPVSLSLDPHQMFAVAGDDIFMSSAAERRRNRLALAMM